MERRTFSRNLSSESKSSSTSLHKKLVLQSRKQGSTAPLPDQPPPDLTDFMNDMFFGTISSEKKSYNLSGGGGGGGFMDDDEEDFDDSLRSDTSNTSTSSSRMTQEWLEEAKRMVASSPSRGGCDSPSRLVGSPRFASVSSQARASASLLDRRDPHTRSARRHRGAERFSGEILSKTAKHTRNKSEPFDQPPQPPPPPVADPPSPASSVHKWFSNILKHPNPNPPPPQPPQPISNSPPTADQNPLAPPLPPTPRRSRFQNSTQPQGIPTHLSKRTFKTAAAAAPAAVDTQLLSPPRNLVESAQGKSISSATFSTEEVSRKPNGQPPEVAADDRGGERRDLNGFLKEQRIKIGKILDGEMNGKAKIVLSGPSNSTSSMVAAICYAWLLENKMRTNKEGVVEGREGAAGVVVVAPVMNMRRGKMWKQRQVAWLFHHVGIDATALLFSDEVELETLMMSKQLTMLVVGQDILKTNGEVGSQCTILTDNFCEDAYDLLQTPIMKKLMLAGILLDTQNLNMSGKISMTRDVEAVQLLTVGSSPNYRNVLYDQLMQDQKDGSFFEALRHNYGKPPNDGGRNTEAQMEHRIQERKSNHEVVTQKTPDKNSNGMKSVTNKMSPKSAKPKSVPAEGSPAAQPTEPASRGKNQFFLAKWFGFGK